MESLSQQAHTKLSQTFLSLPRKHGFHFTPSAKNDLYTVLFSAISASNKYNHLFFPHGLPRERLPDGSVDWSLVKAQGGGRKGGRGEACGHVFKKGEAVYRCRNCGLDDTCVMCSKCFHASDHTGHDTSLSVNGGSGGCCDCGDLEAWKQPLKCAIHSADVEPTPSEEVADPMAKDPTPIPDELKDAIRRTIGQALDFMLDVISCSPENLRLKRNDKDVMTDETSSRLFEDVYPRSSPGDPTEEQDGQELWAVVLWNDESHTFMEVIEQVSRATGKGRAFGQDVANKVDNIGRETVEISSALPHCMKVASVIEQIRLAVTVRSARDVFREEMCGVIVEWLKDIAGCKVGDDDNILREIICEELCKEWKRGSAGTNAGVGLQGYDEVEDASDMESDEDDSDDENAAQVTGFGLAEDVALMGAENALEEILMLAGEDADDGGDMGVQVQQLVPVLNAAAARATAKTPTPPKKVHAKAHWLEKKPVGPTEVWEDTKKYLRLDWLFLFDLRLWKSAREGLRELYIGTMVVKPAFKRIMGIRFARVYPKLAEAFLIADREPEHSIILFSVQIFTVPSIATELVTRFNFFTVLCAALYTFFTYKQIEPPARVDPNAIALCESPSFKNRRYYHLFHDFRYLLNTDAIKKDIPASSSYHSQFFDFVHLFQGINPNKRISDRHVEYESDTWANAFNAIIQVSKLCKLFADAYAYASRIQVCSAISDLTKMLGTWAMGGDRMRFLNNEPKGPVRSYQPRQLMTNRRVIEFEVDKESVSFHHPMHWLLISLVEQAGMLPADMIKQIVLEPCKRVGSVAGYDAFAEAEHVFLAIADYPLRTCVLQSQAKMGFWVRNGVSIRGQQHHYHETSIRVHTYDKDVLFLQLALCIVDPELVLISMMDRFRVPIQVVSQLRDHPAYDKEQYLYMFEEMLALLIALVSERSSAVGWSHEQQAGREIAHALCFGPLTYSDLLKRIPERVADEGNFEEILGKFASFREPDGLNDQGTYQLKDEFFDLVDPYFFHFSRNQREEAESVLTKRLEKKLKAEGKSEKDAVVVPALRPVTNGPFASLGEVVRTPAFVSIIIDALDWVRVTLESSKAETLLDQALHLTILAMKQDKMDGRNAFAVQACTFSPVGIADARRPCILEQLKFFSTIEDVNALHPKISLAMNMLKEFDLQSLPENVRSEIFGESDGEANPSATAAAAEAQRKKEEAKARQAKIMAQMQAQQASFMANMDWGSDEDEDMEDDAPTTGSTPHKHWEFPSGTCILCQEECGESQIYGTLAMVQPTNIFRETPFEQNDFVYEILGVPSSLDRSAEDIRPFGAATLNKEVRSTLSADGKRKKVEDQGLGMGWPPACVRDRKVTTGCGHLMHATCFNQYHESVVQRHAVQSSRNHPENIHRREVLCPLCKSLGNAFLPILWKGKQISYPGELRSDRDLGQFLTEEVGAALGRYQTWGDEPDLQPEIKLPVKFNNSSRELWSCRTKKLRDAVTFYVEDAMFEPVLKALDENHLENAVSHLNFRQMRGVGGDAISESEVLYTMYRRFRASFSAEEERFRSDGGANVKGVEMCWELYASTVAAAEIAQRGSVLSQDPVPQTLMAAIPEQTLTMLKVLWESCMTFTTLGIRLGGRSQMMPECIKVVERTLTQIFFGHPHIDGLQEADGLTLDFKPLLFDDPFEVLVSTAYSLAPALRIDIRHILHLCWIAQVAQIIITIANEIQTEDMTWFNDHRIQAMAGSLQYPEQDLENFRNYTSYLLLHAGGNDIHPDVITKLDTRIWICMVEKYALPFLRKAAIFFYTGCDVEFSDAPRVNEDETELVRLCRLMDLPLLTDICALHESTTADGIILKEMISGWCRHYHWYKHAARGMDLSTEQQSQLTTRIRLPHPTIYELIGLPRRLDILFEASLSHRCHRCGKAPSDPSICLFCGIFVCSQSFCCSEDGKGECNRHAQDCTGSIGMYLMVKKCVILLLYNGNGTFFNAPYLDSHGEVDVGLKRGRPQFLSQKRYDLAVRNLWLSHGVPSYVARKLEANIDIGGWETL
ncbi:E3 ubiquitin-protein ligase ubr1 [Saitoella coloradoensis]